VARWVGAQGPMKMRKRTPIMTSSARKQKSKTFQFKKNRNYESFRIFRGFCFRQL